MIYKLGEDELHRAPVVALMRRSKMKMCCVLQEVHNACYVKLSGAAVIHIERLCHGSYIAVNLKAEVIITI